MEEMYWKVVFQLQDLEQQKSVIDAANAFDLIYEPYELFPDFRKRQQIELLQAVIFELKRDFNEKFAKLGEAKEAATFSISDKNELISELLANLK